MRQPSVPGEIPGERVGNYTVFRRPGELPFRIPAGQDVPLLKGDDPEHMRPQVVADGGVRVFVMSNTDDAAEYARIIDGVAKGSIVLAREEVQWSDAQQSFVVFARWHEMFQEIPSFNQKSIGAYSAY
jgi:hypothetical protein